LNRAPLQHCTVTNRRSTVKQCGRHGTTLSMPAWTLCCSLYQMKGVLFLQKTYPDGPGFACTLYDIPPYAYMTCAHTNDDDSWFLITKYVYIACTIALYSRIWRYRCPCARRAHKFLVQVYGSMHLTTRDQCCINPASSRLDG
jgi:hypothetical protein